MGGGGTDRLLSQAAEQTINSANKLARHPTLERIEHRRVSAGSQHRHGSATVEINVSCKLRYVTAAPTAFVFQIELAKADAQIVKEEILTFPTDATFDVYCDPVTLTRKIRSVLGPGPVEVLYSATANIDSSAFDPNEVSEFDFVALPLEYLDHLLPSRYCQSDLFSDF